MSVPAATDPGPLVQLPDTPLVREARSLVERAAPPLLLSHSLRCFLLGRAYGRQHKIDCDEEGLLLAALFHDLGLAAAHRNPQLPFQRVGSQALRQFLTERGVAAERSSPLAEAIDFHMQLLPRWSRGPAAGLLQVGAWMDITGLRTWSIGSDAKAIAAAYPRGDLRFRFYGMVLGSIGSLGSCLGILFPGRSPG
jgi:hypothetical protein